MRISVFQKFFIALLLSCILVIATMSVLVNASFKEGFQQYLNQEELTKVTALVDRTRRYYSPTHGWHRLTSAPHLWAGLLQQLGELPPPKEMHPPLNKTRSSDSLFSPLSSRLNLLDVDGRVLIGPPENLDFSLETLITKVEITIDSQVVGYISVKQNQSLTNHLAEQFLQSQTKHLATISCAVIVLSLLFSALCARYLLTPLRSLHQGADAVRRGDLSYQIEHRSNDEIADVTQAFNHLVTSLKSQQSLRERWLSDISHELRTPLAVLRAELEALQDGIRKPEPAYIESLHQQVLTLTQLVDDLRAATKADIQFKLEREEVDMISLAENVVTSHSTRYQEKPLSLTHHLDASLEVNSLAILGDKQKLTQVLNNLLENSLRYTDPHGEVRVNLSAQQGYVTLIVEDSSPGVSDTALPKLCERLYRVDQSRSRELGGSGLGLSICKSILEAHHGELDITHSSLGGIKVTITLPLS